MAKRGDLSSRQTHYSFLVLGSVPACQRRSIRAVFCFRGPWWSWSIPT